MRLVSWNIRAGGGTRIAHIATHVAQWRADVVALNEFRGTPASLALAESLTHAGLMHQAHTVNPRAPADNRVFIASRWPIERRLIAGAPERSGKWLAVDVDGPLPCTLISIHVPNRVTGRKWGFHRAALTVARRFGSPPAVMVGDTNTGRMDLDVQDGGTGFNEREDRWMRDLDRAGWRDAFREQHGERREWTWHSPNAGNGYRLDQAFVNPALIDRLRSVRHVWAGFDAGGRRDAVSDHAALIVDFGDGLA